MAGVLAEGRSGGSLAGHLNKGRAEEEADGVGVVAECVPVVEHVDHIVVVGLVRRRRIKAPKEMASIAKKGLGPCWRRSSPPRHRCERDRPRQLQLRLAGAHRTGSLAWSSRACCWSQSSRWCCRGICGGRG